MFVQPHTHLALSDTLHVNTHSFHSYLWRHTPRLTLTDVITHMPISCTCAHTHTHSRVSSGLGRTGAFWEHGTLGSCQGVGRSLGLGREPKAEARTVNEVGTAPAPSQAASRSPASPAIVSGTAGTVPRAGGTRGLALHCPPSTLIPRRAGCGEGKEKEISPSRQCPLASQIQVVFRGAQEPGVALKAPSSTTCSHPSPGRLAQASSSPAPVLGHDFHPLLLLGSHLPSSQTVAAWGRFLLLQLHVHTTLST